MTPLRLDHYSTLDQIETPVSQVTADGTYDGAPTYRVIADHGEAITVAIPPDPRLSPERTRVPRLSATGTWRSSRKSGGWRGKKPGVWKAGVGGNNDGVLQNAHRLTTASPSFCSTTGGGRHRGCGSEPLVVDSAASFSPQTGEIRLSRGG